MRYWKPILVAILGAAITYHVSTKNDELDTGLFAFFVTIVAVLLFHEIAEKR